MEWYWILIILSAVIGPFEAMYTLNKARRKREEARKKEAGQDGKPRPGADGEEREDEPCANGQGRKNTAT